MAKKKKETAKKKQATKVVKAAAKKTLVKKAPVKKTPVTKAPVSKKQAKKPEPKQQPVKTEVKNIEVTKGKKEKEKKVKASVPQNQPPRPATVQSGKKRLLISYDKLPDEVVDIIRGKYPYGYNHDLIEVKGIDNKKFSVLPIELPDVVYLVKVDLRKPFKIEEAEEEEDIFTPEEGFGAGEEDNFPGEDLEGIEGEDGEEDGKKKKKKSDEENDD